MRKSAVLTAVLFFVGLMVAPAASAGTVSLSLQNTTPNTTIFTISGTYDPGVPTTMISTPGGTYSISFTLNTAVSTNAGFVGDAADGLFQLDANFSLSLNGGTAMTFGMPFIVEFDTTTLGNFGGLIFCFDNSGTCSSHTDWDIIGQQLFTGDIGSPSTLAFINTPNAQVNQTMSGYTINGVGPFPFGSAPTPEPAPLLLLGTGLLSVGILARKKLHIV